MDVLAVLRSKIVSTAAGGEEWRFNCPECLRVRGRPDTKAHLYYNIRSGMFFCHRCGFKGQGAAKVLRAFGIDAKEGVRRPRPARVLKEPPTPSTVVTLPEKAQPVERGTAAWNYLTRVRGLPEKWIRTLGLLDWEGECRIVVPIYEKGDLIYWVARTYIDMDPKYRNPRVPRKEVIFNWDLTRRSERVYICEGVFSAIQFGPHHGLALLSKKVTRAQLRKLIQHPAKELVVALDGDAVEDAVENKKTPRYTLYSLAGDLYRKVGHEKTISWIRFPGSKDPGDFSHDEVRRLERKPFDPLSAKLEVLK